MNSTPVAATAAPLSDLVPTAPATPKRNRRTNRKNTKKSARVVKKSLLSKSIGFVKENQGTIGAVLVAGIIGTLSFFAGKNR